MADAVMPRKYSVAEIDRMRRAVARQRGFGGIVDAQDREERLRTYMLNGTSPDEMDEAYPPRCWPRSAL